MLSSVDYLYIIHLSSLSLQTALSSVAFCKHQVTQQLVRHPGSVRPDEQNSVAEYIIHFSSKSNKVSKFCHLISICLTLCYTCKWWHALKQQCRNFQSSTTTKKAWKCSRLFCQDQDQDQDFYLKTKTKTKTCVLVLEAPRDQDLGLEDYITDENPKSFVIKMVTWGFDRNGRNHKGPRMPDWSSLRQKLPGVIFSVGPNSSKLIQSKNMQLSLSRLWASWTFI